ncbi:YueH family protein [Staphylococcus pettenkoferi]|uniref:YueH family protein n=1 Tax=Staphylococcus pettenkoferi TaxID=170573 RepID=UPI0014730203|nr:YueH family protein [Staphylococcus pettenkoferi]MCI2803005.1 YueH family protein [Staphylococcus pettenkoferi]MCY1573804.1 YueH family protein [Staphylococcus pettenkoferi]MCY1578033.1 YueH family protein [Staphylococcus pettenkoferi]MCY1584750.1 YueH family protein [Staphylococcus pettenkoferi]MCY1615579.1 YueH family protein [Staphylococcus pettenkoferi]
MKIKEVQLAKVARQVYLYKNESERATLIAIPDLEWSMLLPDTQDEQELEMELVMHLFTIMDDDNAEHIARQIIQWLQ